MVGTGRGAVRTANLHTNANAAASLEDGDQPIVAEGSVVDGADHGGVHADHQQDERPGDAGQDHGADREGAGAEECQRRRIGHRSRLETEEGEDGDRHCGHQQHVNGGGVTEKTPGNGRGGDHQAEEQSGHLLGVVVQLRFDHRGE